MNSVFVLSQFESYSNHGSLSIDQHTSLLSSLFRFADALLNSLFEISLHLTMKSKPCFPTLFIETITDLKRTNCGAYQCQDGLIQ